MEALISSYTEKDTNERQLTDKSFIIPHPKQFHSILVSKPSSEGINMRILSLLKSYRKLSNNWDFDDALAPSDTVITKSESIALMLQKIGQKIYHTAPGPNGEIMLDLRDIDHLKSIEIIVYDNKINLVYIPETSLPTQENFSFSKLKDYLIWLNK